MRGGLPEEEAGWEFVVQADFHFRDVAVEGRAEIARAEDTDGAAVQAASAMWMLD
jgi:hypothetical protein